MNIVLDKSSATEALIKITLNEKDYQPKVEEKVKDYSRKANIKGFRPGKVPLLTLVLLTLAAVPASTGPRG